MAYDEYQPSSLPGSNDIVRHQIDSGIAVLVRENHSSPAVVVSGYLPIGAIDVPADKAGLAAFTASALMRGTNKRDFTQIYEAIESVGADVSFSSGGHTTNFGAKSLAEDLPLILEILAEAVRYPTFDAAEVERLRGQILTALDVRANDTGAMASLSFRELAYPHHHPYSRSVQGYTETIRALSRDDLESFHREGYGAQGLIICIVGAVRADDALAQVEAAFAGWRGRTIPRRPLPAVSRSYGLVRKLVEMPNKSQADIVIGLPGPARAEPDYLDAAVANHILGVFGMMGRLGERLRDEQGLAYSVYSRLEGGSGPGPWIVAAGVDPANIERTVAGVRSEIRRLRDTLPEPGELADVKANLIGSLPLSLETNEGVSGAILNMERYELGLDYLSRYPRLVHDITPERVQAAVRKWLDPDTLAIGIAGTRVDVS